MHQTVFIYTARESWYGVTYKAELVNIAAHLRALHQV